VLYQALARTERVVTLARLAVAGAVATLAAVAVLQAIDGVALFVLEIDATSIR
jgi:hypothetical protein